MSWVRLRNLDNGPDPLGAVGPWKKIRGLILCGRLLSTLSSRAWILPCVRLSWFSSRIIFVRHFTIGQIICALTLLFPVFVSCRAVAFFRVSGPRVSNPVVCRFTCWIQCFLLQFPQLLCVCVCVCFCSWCRPVRSLFRLELLALFVCSLYAETIKDVNSWAALLVSHPS
jgi:hypothetical protein